MIDVAIGIIIGVGLTIILGSLWLVWLSERKETRPNFLRWLLRGLR